MKLKVKDKVLVITGKDKGKVGHITKVITKHNKIVVENVNFLTKHIKKTQQGPGQKIRYEGPISASNVMILDPKTGKPTRIGYKLLDNRKKERFSKLSGVSLENVASAPVSEVTEPKAKPVIKGKKTTKKTIKA